MGVVERYIAALPRAAETAKAVGLAYLPAAVPTFINFRGGKGRAACAAIAVAFLHVGFTVGANHNSMPLLLKNVFILERARAVLAASSHWALGSTFLRV